VEIEAGVSRIEFDRLRSLLRDLKPQSRDLESQPRYYWPVPTLNIKALAIDRAHGRDSPHCYI